jgi:bacteriophage HK97-gp10 putative tail-component
MAASLLVWDGMQELQAAIRALPEALTGEAMDLVERTVNMVAADIRQAYPSRTGNLRKGVRVSSILKKGFVAGAIVKNTAKHAVLFELGTQARHNKLGANRGSMPPGHVFVPRVLKARRALTQQLKDMVARHGAVTVTGD